MARPEPHQRLWMWVALALPSAGFWFEQATSPVWGPYHLPTALQLAR